MATVVITGANRGLGLGLAERYAERGDRVLACARDPNASSLIALAANKGERVTIHLLDVADPASVAEFASEVADTPVDLLINNAGIYGPEHQSALDMDFDGFARALAVNTLSPLRVSAALIANLRAAKNAKIVTISSRMGQITRPDRTTLAYRASKAAVNKVMQGLALELEPEGITVAVVHPGWVRTDMGGENATLSIDESVGALVATIDALTLAKTGGFFNYDGKPLDW
jgi:NAD(P)-dependent dehydrogenase (short-subunit alcohol dehydrogenase family)